MNDNAIINIGKNKLLIAENYGYETIKIKKQVNEYALKVIHRHNDILLNLVYVHIQPRNSQNIILYRKCSKLNDLYISSTAIIDGTKNSVLIKQHPVNVSSEKELINENTKIIKQLINDSPNHIKYLIESSDISALYNVNYITYISKYISFIVNKNNVSNNTERKYIGLLKINLLGFKINTTIQNKTIIDLLDDISNEIYNILQNKGIGSISKIYNRCLADFDQEILMCKLGTKLIHFYYNL